MRCFLCPRKCGAERAVSPGFCGAPEKPLVAKAMLHFWEEPFISGKNGSGAVFFSGCNLGCVFCQNHVIRDGGVGEALAAPALADLYLSLQTQGAHNINLVTAAPYVPDVAESLHIAKSHGLHIPVVYNSGGYELPDTLRMLDGLVDVYLPDLKYVSSDLSGRFSSAPDYFSAALPALLEMFRQVGGLSLDENGIAKRGLVIRHLVLPNCVDDSRRVLDAIVTHFPLSTQLSLMSQYTPPPHVTDGPLRRRITAREYERVISYALSLGLYNILIQQRDSANPDFTPTFTNQQ
ncbi:MAG TPA: radical SAM protein [Eubacteriales bacterium]|nr:radical SAM protein [Eubacteriales bacterium]